MFTCSAAALQQPALPPAIAPAVRALSAPQTPQRPLQIRAGTYPAYGVTALAGCRPLDLFTSAAGSEGTERRRRHWEVEGEGELGANTEQHKARRVQDPVQGWW